MGGRGAGQRGGEEGRSRTGRRAAGRGLRARPSPRARALAPSRAAASPRAGPRRPSRARPLLLPWPPPPPRILRLCLPGWHLRDRQDAPRQVRARAEGRAGGQVRGAAGPAPEPLSPRFPTPPWRPPIPLRIPHPPGVLSWIRRAPPRHPP